MTQGNLLHKFLIFFFKLLYHQFAWCYDFVAFLVSASHWKSWVLSVEKYIAGPDILELGHGPGHLQAHLKNRYPFLIGLDESRQMGKLALKNIHKAYPDSPKALVQALAQSIPFQSAQFNTVVATFPTQYIIEKACLKEVYRVLKSNGKFVVLLAVQITGTSITSRLLKALYSLTGEVPTQEIQNHIMETLAEHGFFSQINWLEHKNGRLLLITAQKM